MSAIPLPAIDQETRERLLDVAARLFSSRGFAKVTVRDICREARANVAAVNYHFGGKQALYEDVLRRAMTIMQATTEQIRAAGVGLTPEGQLEVCIRLFLTRVMMSRDNWIHQLMTQELAEPTPSIDLILDNVLRPRLAYISSVIAAVIGCPVEDPRVRLCLMSVQAQLMALLRNPIAERLGMQEAMTAERVDALGRHITQFSIAGIRAVEPPPTSEARPLSQS